MSPFYFGNEVVAVSFDGLASVRCGCGCGEEGRISAVAAREFQRRYGDLHAGQLLVLEGHGAPLETARGTLHLAPAPPEVIYCAMPDVQARDVVALANMALRGLARPRLCS